jgi:hypothetical protein
MLKVIRKNYEEAREGNPSLESTLVASLDITIKSKETDLTRVRKQAFRKLISNGMKEGADYIFINSASYVPLSLPYVGIWYFIKGEARQKINSEGEQR